MGYLPRSMLPPACAIVLAIGVIIGFAKALTVPAKPDAPVMPSPQDVFAEIEQHVPFNIKTPEQPTPSCDPVDMELLVIMDSQNRDMDYRWRILDRGVLLFECGDFYDLYYRCDGHGCYNVRVVRQPENSSRRLASKPLHICIKS